MKPEARLRIERLQDFVRLGCSPEERAHVQPVEMSVTLDFRQIPGACQSDELSETVCYEKISHIFRRQVAAGEYKTIECLAYRCFGELLELLQNGDELTVLIKKLNPPLAMTNAGAFFELRGVRDQPQLSSQLGSQNAL